MPVEACPDCATEASSHGNDDVDASADPSEKLGLTAKVGWYISAVAHGGARAGGLALSALASSVCAN